MEENKSGTCCAGNHADTRANGKKCGCGHHRAFPVLVILFALTFLLGALDVLTARAVSITWPVLVGIAGMMKLGAGRCKCC